MVDYGDMGYCSRNRIFAAGERADQLCWMVAFLVCFDLRSVPLDSSSTSDGADNIIHESFVLTSGVNLAWSRAACVATLREINQRSFSIGHAILMGLRI